MLTDIIEINLPISLKCSLSLKHLCIHTLVCISYPIISNTGAYINSFLSRQYYESIDDIHSID